MKRLLILGLACAACGGADGYSGEFRIVGGANSRVGWMGVGRFVAHVDHFDSRCERREIGRCQMVSCPDERTENPAFDFTNDTVSAGAVTTTVLGTTTAWATSGGAATQGGLTYGATFYSPATAGDTVTLAAEGDPRGVAPFVVEATLPEAPGFEPLQLPVRRGAPLTLSWNRVANYAEIVTSSATFNTTFMTRCPLDSSERSFTFPAELMEQVPAAGTHSVGIDNSSRGEKQVGRWTIGLTLPMGGGSELTFE